jgi:hypothetical protein
MTKAEKKAARHRRASREWMRRHRARKAEATDGAEPFNFEEPAPAVIVPQATRESQVRAAFQHRPAAPTATAPAPTLHAASLPELMPEPTPRPTRPEPILFNTAQDKFRPSWWSVVDPHGADIQIGFSPRAVRRNPPIALAGTFNTAHDPGILFSEDTGHVDIAAEQVQRAQEADRQRGDHRSWKSGQEENE